MERGRVGGGGCRESFQSVSPTLLLKMEMTFISLAWNLPNSGKGESKCAPLVLREAFKPEQPKAKYARKPVVKSWGAVVVGGGVGSEIHSNAFISHCKYALSLK